MGYKMQTKRLKDMNREEIEELMLSEGLLNMATIGRHFDISRERVRQIFSEKNIDFKAFKKGITVAVHQTEIALENEEWKLIDFYNTAHKYYISNFGRVARELNKTINGTTYPQKKLLQPSAGKCGRLRVNLSLSSEEGEDKNKPFTVYVHILVLKAFSKDEISVNDNKQQIKRKRIRHLDKNVQNNHLINLQYK